MPHVTHGPVTTDAGPYRSGELADGARYRELVILPAEDDHPERMALVRDALPLVLHYRPLRETDPAGTIRCVVQVGPRQLRHWAQTMPRMWRPR